MGYYPSARVFYGIKLNISDFPDKVERLMEESDWETGISQYLLEETGHAIDAEGWVSENDLPGHTGIRVLDLDKDGLFLTIDETYFAQTTYGIEKINLAPVGMEEVLRLENFARLLGTDVKLGDWYLRANYS